MANAFDTLNAAAATWNQATMGTAFTHGISAASLTGVLNQPSAEFSFDETGTRRLVDRVLVASKSQFATVPANRDTITSGGIAYTVDAIDGLNDAGEPCYTLYLRVQT